MALTKTTALKLLGLEAGASEDEIKKAYRKLARKYHPDVSEETNAEAQFKEIKEAYEFLTAPPSAKGGTGPSWNGRNVQDMLDEMMATAMEAQRRQAEANANKPVRFTSFVKVSLKDAFKGTESNLSFSAIGDEKHRIEFPPGLVPGCPLRMLAIKDKNGRRIDIDVRADIDPGEYNISWAAEPYLYGGAIEGSGDMEKIIRLNWKELVFGGKYEYETIDGAKLEIRIAPGTQAGNRLKIKGRGYWRDAHQSSRGDVYLRVMPITPKIMEMSTEELAEAAKLFGDAHAERVKMEEIKSGIDAGQGP